MDEYRNRGSPRLQFTREELENDALSRPVIAIGAGLGIWGVVNLLEGYGNDNRATRS